jgi:hypothetical protein
MRSLESSGIILCWITATLLVDGVRGAQRAGWSNRTLGPDGPWNALEITIGADQVVTIYGGKMWESYVLGSSYCKSTTTGGQRCYAAEENAIYYETRGTGSNMDIEYQPPQLYSENTHATGTGTTRWADDVYISDDTSPWGLGPVRNVSMALMDDAELKYPNGNSYPLFAGCLAFGAGPKQVNQTFQTTAGTLAGAINVSLIAGSFAAHGKIESNSFGMHIGSGAEPAVPGSRWFGGYDQNRVLNEVLAVPIEPDYLNYTAELSDVSINVLAGDSPFSFPSISGLLASGNMTIGHTLKVGIDPCIPYLNLPASTCDAIAANLPMKYDPGLGLYLWDIESADYPRVVSSASALTFSFPDPDNNSRTVNISVPFRHLNLTLQEPLVSSPVPYFPCNAGSDGHYALGRAFLQDAFFGSNFENAVMFLAQAPGPNLKTENIVTIATTDTVLDASRNDLVKSWDGFWTLSAQGNETSINGSPSPSPSPSASGSTGTSDNGNSNESSNAPATRTPLIAGLVTGLVVAFAVVALGLTCFCRRRNRGKAGDDLAGNPNIPTGYYDPKYTQAPSELNTEPTSELPGNPRAELASAEQTAYETSGAWHIAGGLPEHYSPQSAVTQEASPMTFEVSPGAYGSNTGTWATRYS